MKEQQENAKSTQRESSDFFPYITQDLIIPSAVKQRHLVQNPTRKGDMYYGLGNSFANMPIGGSGKVLRSTGSIPSWANLFVDNTHTYELLNGTVSISLSAQATKNQAVTFSTAFTSSCTQVILSVNNSTNDPSTYTVGLKSLTKTGFTIYITSSTSTTDTVTVAFVAIGY